MSASKLQAYYWKLEVRVRTSDDSQLGSRVEVRVCKPHYHKTHFINTFTVLDTTCVSGRLSSLKKVNDSLCYALTAADLIIGMFHKLFEIVGRWETASKPRYLPQQIKTSAYFLTRHFKLELPLELSATKRFHQIIRIHEVLRYQRTSLSPFCHIWTIPARRRCLFLEKKDLLWLQCWPVPLTTLLCITQKMGGYFYKSERC